MEPGMSEQRRKGRHTAPTESPEESTAALPIQEGEEIKDYEDAVIITPEVFPVVWDADVAQKTVEGLVVGEEVLDFEDAEISDVAPPDVPEEALLEGSLDVDSPTMEIPVAEPLSIKPLSTEPLVIIEPSATDVPLQEASAVPPLPPELRRRSTAWTVACVLLFVVLAIGLVALILTSGSSSSGVSSPITTPSTTTRGIAASKGALTAPAKKGVPKLRTARMARPAPVITPTRAVPIVANPATPPTTQPQTSYIPPRAPPAPATPQAPQNPSGSIAPPSNNRGPSGYIAP